MENPASDSKEVHIIVKIFKAVLTRNFETIGGKMDLYSIAEYYASEDSKKVLLGRTRTLWNVGRTAQWDYTCKSQVYDKTTASSSRLEIRLFEDNVVTTATHCGTATLDLSTIEFEPSKKKSMELPLVLEGSTAEHTGTVTIHLNMVEVVRGDNEIRGSLIQKSLVSSDDFEAPVKRLGVSGGTAPFFKLVYKSEDEEKSPSYYIGKDLSRATDEIMFYEYLLEMKKKKSFDLALNETLVENFMFDYAGVLVTKEADVDEDAPTLELLCLRNLYDGMKKLRLLDIKMGQRTAAANWQGKSRARAMKQGILDGWTNSACEGFRLEGIDGPPPALESMNPLHDTVIKDEKSQKKALRFMYQRMNGSDILMHFMDTHQEPFEKPDEFDLNTTLSSTEYSEIILSEIVTRMVNLCVACHNVPVPQKWIGSSVALGFDSGALPPRSSNDEDEAALRKKVIVSVFDWGRSELNTLQNHQQLSDEEKNDRNKYWKFYTGGIDKLAWDAANLYFNRYSNVSGWANVTFYIYDYDSITPDDFIGKVTVPMIDTNGEFISQTLLKRSTSLLKGKRCEIHYSMSYVPYPESSRLAGSWRVTLQKCVNLPKKDVPFPSRVKGKSDPYCVIVGESKDGYSRFNQVTCMIPNDINPEWNESFNFPVAKPNSLLLSKALGPKLGTGNYYKMFEQVYPKKESLTLAGKISQSTSSIIPSGKKADAVNVKGDGFPYWSKMVSSVFKD